MLIFTFLNIISTVIGIVIIHDFTGAGGGQHAARQLTQTSTKDCRIEIAILSIACFIWPHATLLTIALILPVSPATTNFKLETSGQNDCPLH